jgi:hypothetical protein
MFQSFPCNNVIIGAAGKSRVKFPERVEFERVSSTKFSTLVRLAEGPYTCQTAGGLKQKEAQIRPLSSLFFFLFFLQ